MKVHPGILKPFVLGRESRFAQSAHNSAIRSPQSAICEGFTLIEMMVVIAIIALVSASVLPSAMQIFTSGSEAQTYNLLIAHLAAARGLAITSGDYACVHVQQADPNQTSGTGLIDAWYVAILTHNASSGLFSLADGYTPRRLPGSMVFGEFSSTHVTGTGNYQNIGTQAQVENFTCFTIVFSPSGSIVRQVGRADITFDSADLIFAGQTSPPIAILWDDAVANRDADQDGATDSGEDGVAAVVLFDYSKFKTLSAAARPGFLQSSGRLISINLYTGQPF